MRKIIIAGANGFLGRYLTRHFHANGWEVVGMARREKGLDPNCRYVHWDGKTLDAWAGELEGCDAIVNLAGRSINCRHNTSNKRQILESRVDSTTVLGEAIRACSNPPGVWLNASTAAIYRELKDRAQCEGGLVDEGFAAKVAKEWEAAFFGVKGSGDERKVALRPAMEATARVMLVKKSDNVRKVALRTSLVMAKEPGTVYSYLYKLSKLFLGGAVAGGKQMVSWIHIDDYCRAVEWLIEHGEIRGAINITSPEPLTNAEMMSRFRKLAKRPFGLPAAVWMIQIGAFFLRTEPKLILESRWVMPKRLQQNGFVFNHPEMKPSEW